jgi:2-iminobutanoate/2-iminopropanoate deaminase
MATNTKKTVKKNSKKTSKKAVKKTTKKPVKKVAKSAAPLGPYTPVVRAGDWVIVSGQLGVVDGKIVKGGVAAQTAQAIVNLKSQLASAGVTINDVKKTLCFLTDMDTFGTFNTAYVEGFVTSLAQLSSLSHCSHSRSSWVCRLLELQRCSDFFCSATETFVTPAANLSS